MGVDELYKGLDRLKAGVTQFASSAAINDAQKQVQELNQQQQSEAERLQSLNMVSQDLALRLAKAGASAGDVEALAGRFGISSSAQYQGLQNEKLQQNSQDFQARENALNRQSQERLASAKATQETKAKTVPAAVLAKMQSLDEQQNSLSAIHAQLDDEDIKSQLGPMQQYSPATAVRKMTDPKTRAFFSDLGRTFDKYRAEITGASAPVAELKMLQANTIGPGDTADAMKAKIKTMQILGDSTKLREHDRLQSMGFKVESAPTLNSGFSDVDIRAYQWYLQNQQKQKDPTVQKVKAQLMKNGLINGK